MLSIKKRIGETLLARFKKCELLILQPTPFCNLNCRYCYLPNRSDKTRMKMDTVSTVFQKILPSNVIGEEVTILWHAGEPLAVPIDFYREAITPSHQFRRSNTRVSHMIQTNATLINDEWCRFFKESHMSVGVSIDGPAFVHDFSRKTRTGRGTHAMVMRGIEKLKEHGISFSVISVVSSLTLNHVPEVYHFLKSLGATEIGFSFEETEGIHTASSLGVNEEGIRQFHRQLRELWLQDPNPPRLREKPYMNPQPKVSVAPELLRGRGTQSNEAFRILTVGANGELSTFSPELLGQKSEDYNNFILGNILQQDLEAMTLNPTFLRIFKEVEAGRTLCRETCPFFYVCGGGEPSEKFAESGRFDISETRSCRARYQLLSESFATARATPIVNNNPHKKEYI